MIGKSAVFAVLLASSATLAFTHRESADEAAIRETIQAYFDGLMKYDAASLERAFHPDALLSASLPRGYFRTPFAEWKKFANGAAPSSEGQKNHILSIDIAGN